jgi:hypothetical protein
MVANQLRGHFGIDDSTFSVRRTRPDDFIVRFTRQEDLDIVLRSPWPAAAPFQLRWRRWSRIIAASVGSFRFRVLVAIKGIPAHARSIDTVQGLLASSCVKPEIAGAEALPGEDDEREIFVAAWCANPNLVPDEMVLAIPEAETVHDGGPPLFLRPWEVIHDEVPALRY